MKAWVLIQQLNQMLLSWKVLIRYVLMVVLFLLLFGLMVMVL